jgi:hypothetical protein
MDAMAIASVCSDAEPLPTMWDRMARSRKQQENAAVDFVKALATCRDRAEKSGLLEKE